MWLQCSKACKRSLKNQNKPRAKSIKATFAAFQQQEQLYCEHSVATI